ncbi:hypothetical protein cypCar_00047858, partial [Cyprinus carpio]
LMEETYTVDEVSDMLDGLQVLVHGEVEMELINTAHTNVLLLRQLFSQAEKFYLRLQTDISELENRELLDQVAEFEKTDFKANSKAMSALDDKSKAERALKELQKSQGDQQELEKKFQQTAAYRNMKEILTKKNEQIKDLRKRLQRYESDE